MFCCHNRENSDLLLKSALSNPITRVHLDASQFTPDIDMYLE